MTAPINAPKTVWVCDWTHWQGVVVPAKGIADEGYGMVKLKAGGASKEGKYFEDPRFFENAVALVQEPRLIPAAYWYLMPGRAKAQVGLFYDMLSAFAVSTWAAFLDVEQPGVTWTDVLRFGVGWEKLTGGQPLGLYTSKRFWTANILGAIGVIQAAPVFPFLEEAHWVSEAVRKVRPYASQQAREINPAWWNVGYGGWERASMMQFTDNALVQGKRTTASLYPGTMSGLKAALLRR